MRPVAAADPPTHSEAAAALRKAAGFFHENCSKHGGYVWRYSRDLALSEGESETDEHTIWVQPPGTPAVGEAFLDAYEATDEGFYLTAARQAGRALVKGQLESGGWYYSVTFEPQARKTFWYRADLDNRRSRDEDPGGWDVWKKRRYKGNMTIVDDDVTPGALRFLMRLDRTLDGKDRATREVVEYGLASLSGAQYPIGAWSHNYDRFPRRPPAADHYPVLRASFPDDWSRTWTKDFTGCYMINDRITMNAIETMLAAWRTYGEQRYLASAERGGQFLLLAQLPEPRPAWAQQYNRRMQPVWDRKFEPPAVTGLESQDVLETLLLLYRETGDRKYLEPVPKALAYLKSSRLADGNLARFYELKTNRPLYFTKDYRLTSDPSESPTHYAFVVQSRLDEIEAEYKRLLEHGSDAPGASDADAAKLGREVRRLIDTMDERGAWIDQRSMKGFRKASPEGVIQSETFIANVRTLCRYLERNGKDLN